MPKYPLYQFGLPPDGVALGALLLALVCWAVRLSPRQRGLATRSSAIGAIALLAAAASLGYFHYYLGGAPRIIDATAYLLEGRLLAAGEFTFLPPEPSSLFRGRFLIHPPGEPLRLGVIFPPGYPALLALGVRLGSYEVIGPLLAFALVVVTSGLAYAATQRRAVALVAALFSLLSACLRYHTADTMSHGWAALLATSLILSTLRLARLGPTRERWPLALLAGTAAGLSIATRELTGLVFVGVCGAFLIVRLWRSPRLLPWFVLGALPGFALLLAHHHALTGEWWGSPQLRYYALADGPPGCFGLGFGKGCQFEHADVVRTQGGGLSPLWALRNTLHRLHAHSMDIANFEPLALVGPWWLWRRRRSLAGRLFLTLTIALPSAYAFFYFNGSYPGGGARFLAELLPLQHVALAAALTSLRRVRLGLCLSLLGFACHASFSHVYLREQTRETWLPGSFDTTQPRLVFVETDHAFLAHFDPAQLPRARTLQGTLLARRGASAAERHLWETVGRPPAFVSSKAPAPLVPWLPAEPAAVSPLLIEAEGEWPVLEQSGLWAHPAYPPGSCVSQGRSLLLHPLGLPAHATPRAEAPWLIVDASSVPPGRYQVVAVYWSASTECFHEALGERSLPGSLRVELLTPLETPRHLDRLELHPVEP